MLQNRLEHASKKASRTRLMIFGGMALTVIIVGLGFLSAILYQDLSALRRTQQTAPTADQNAVDNWAAEDRNPLPQEPGERISSAPVLPSTTDTPVPLPALPLVEPVSKSFAETPVQGADTGPIRPRQQMPEPPPRPVTAPNGPVEIAAPPTAGTGDHSQVPEASQTLAAASDKTPAEPLAERQPTRTINAPQTIEDREAFKDLLLRLEGGPEPIIQSESFRDWRPEKQRDIEFLKQQAYAAFGDGDYAQARKHLEQAYEMASQEARALETTFQRALGDAAAAKQADDYDRAKTQIDQALRLAPESEQAKNLKPLINVMPQVQELLKSAGIKRTENNAQGEYDYLNDALKLDPTRQEVRQRATQLAHTLKQQNFLLHINGGFSEVDKRQLKGAQSHHLAAQKLFPSRAETALLGARVGELKSDLETQHFIGKAKAAAAADNWQQSLQLFTTAKKIQANNRAAVDGVALAQSVVNLQRQVTQHLDRAQRLASGGVAKAAHQLVKKAQSLATVSPSLDAQTSRLADLLAAYAVDVPVKVLSDEKTRISVRGVGQVGTTKEKIIKLKPGTYTFEGKCAGFKSKLIAVNIPPGATAMRVSIVCDERI